MNDQSYGMDDPIEIHSECGRVCEEILINGWSRIEKLVSLADLDRVRELIDEIYEKQESEFGREMLLRCHEADQVRCLTRYDKIFLQIAKAPRLVAILSQLIGEYHILMLQNAVINRPDCDNHQSNWHRDLPHQNFTSSEPLAINMVLVIDAFSQDSGGTDLIPFSHKMDHAPSQGYIDKHKVSISAEPGDILCFDSMLIHRAGINRSSNVRRAMNTQYSRPFIKPQYAFDKNVPEDFIEDENDKRLLGVTSATVLNEKEWRRNRINRLNKTT